MSGGFSGWLFVLLLAGGFGEPVDEGLGRRAAVHVAALMGPALIVADEEVVENNLHLLDGFEPGSAALDAEVLVEQRAVEALDDAVGLWPLYPGRAVLDLLQLQEQFVGAPQSGRPQNSRPLSDSTVSILAWWASKVGMTSPFIR